MTSIDDIPIRPAHLASRGFQKEGTHACDEDALAYTRL